MEAIEALLNRVSCGKLTAPAPTGEQRNILYKAALRAADHGGLQPWRFLVIEGEGLNALGELFMQAAVAADANLSDVQRERFGRMPTRAPLIIAAIACGIDHPKVPVVEQLLATGAAVQNLLTAAFAQGVGAYWRTGAMVECAQVREGLGVQAEETLIGFIYFGTPCVAPKPAPEVNTGDFFVSWPQK